MTPSCKRPFLESFKIWLSHANKGFWIYRIKYERNEKMKLFWFIFVNWHFREKPRPHKSRYFWNLIYIHFSHESAVRLVFRPRPKPVNPLTETLGWFSNRTGTSVDDGKARGKDWTRLTVLNSLLCHWSSQLFDLHASSSTDVPVLLLNQPTIFLKPLSGVV